jgi:hypothetical protein
MAGIHPSGAAQTAAEVPAAPAIAAAGESSCACTIKCPCGCSPLAGAWVARLSSYTDNIVQTFKFAPINEGCSMFVVNSQATTRSAQVVKFWPDACQQTEFVGTACPGEWGDVVLTAVSYGVKRCNPADKVSRTIVVNTAKPAPADEVVFIAILTAKVEMPASCLTCYPPGTNDSGKDAVAVSGTPSGTPDGKPDGSPDGTCKAPDELPMLVYVSYYDASQDQDGDGFPDTCEAVLCVCYETRLKRVQVTSPCAESKSFVACLEPCEEDPNQPATGRAFFRVIEEEQKVCFVLTAKDLENVTKACIALNYTRAAGGTCVVTLFPFPPAKAPKNKCDGLLSCGCFTTKDCVDLWKGKKLPDIVRAIEEGQASVVVFTEQYPNGLLCGSIEDP